MSAPRIVPTGISRGERGAKGDTGPSGGPFPDLTGVTAGKVPVTTGGGGVAFEDLTASIGALVNPVKRSNTLGALGDSFTDNVGGIGGFAFSTGYLNWFQVLSGHRLNLVYIDGIAGSSQADVGWAARVTALAASRARRVVVMIGTNGVNGGSTSAAIIAADKTTIETLLAAGKQVIFPTLPPRDGISSGKRTVWGEVNRARREYPSIYPDVIVPDVASYLSDAASSTPATWAPGYSSDGVHPDPLGCKIIGQCFADAFLNTVPNVSLLGPPSDPANLLGQIAASWAGGNSGTPTYWGSSIPGATFSQHARTDGVAGVVQRVVVPNGAAGVINCGTPGAGPTSYSVGDRLVGYVEIVGTSSVDASPATDTQWLYLVMQSTNPSYAVVDVVADLYRLNSGTNNVPPPAAGVLQCGPMTVSAGATQSVGLAINISGGGTYDFGRVGVVKVSTDY